MLNNVNIMPRVKLILKTTPNGVNSLIIWPKCYTLSVMSVFHVVHCHLPLKLAVAPKKDSSICHCSRRRTQKDIGDHFKVGCISVHGALRSRNERHDCCKNWAAVARLKSWPLCHNLGPALDHFSTRKNGSLSTQLVCCLVHKNKVFVFVVQATVQS